MRKLIFSKVWRMAVLFWIFFSIPVFSSANFDFYASDMITKESYRKISMDFKDASLRNILKLFSEQAGLNFIAAQGVQDRAITLYLDNVPLQEALNKIMSANNLTYELEPGSNIFIVKEWGRPAVETITKVYQLKYTRLSTSGLSKAIGGGSSGDSSSGGSSSGGSSGGSSSGGVESSVQGVLTANGKIMQDPRTNSLIVTDIPSQFEVIDRIVALLDVSTPQVMIEVEMLDVSKTTIDQMGINMGSTLLSLQGAGTQTKFPFFADAAATRGADSTTFTFGTLSSEVFQATLELMTSDSSTKYLARPRILTLSNEAAEIKISTNEAIGLTTSTSATGGTGTTTVGAERAETGVTLKVTPQVDPSTGTVTMFIQPSVSEAKTGGTFGGTTFKDPETRSSSTTLMIKNGETIVVGGLIRTVEETTVKKFPLMGDIPVLGAAFRYKNTSLRERELIVFITPRIIDSDNVIDFAKKDPPSLLAAPRIPYREQSAAVSKKEAIDNMLERWED